MKQKFRALVDGNLIEGVQPLFYLDNTNTFLCTRDQVTNKSQNGYCTAMSVNEIVADSIDQFTGILDVDKQEIYERDVVEVGYGRGQVVFHAGCYMIQWIDDPEALMELLSFDPYGFKYGRMRDDLKKVGNVYGVLQP